LNEFLMQYSKSSRVRVQVHVRLRPALAEGAADLCDAGDGAAEAKGKLLYLHDLAKSHSSEFVFDTVLDSQTTQEEVFACVGAPLVHHALSGRNSCCFAYGNTGSGKTYSIHGKV
jgi:hypothetical protein